MEILVFILIRFFILKINNIWLLIMVKLCIFYHSVLLLGYEELLNIPLMISTIQL